MALKGTDTDFRRRLSVWLPFIIFRFFFFLQHCTDAIVLLDNRLLKNFILNYMRDLTGILSISLLVRI